MAQRSATVATLAKEADLELDEAIVMLWDAGIDHVSEPDDQILRADLRRARNALGIDDPKQQRTVDYWIIRTGVDRADLADLLAEMGIRLPRNARVLPPGALKKLRRRFALAPTLSVTESENLEPQPPFQWLEIGGRRDISFLTESEVCEIHLALARDFAGADDPIEPPGVRSDDLLSSAVHRPQTSLGGELKYPTVEMAAAALMHSLVLNHPFHNGNKRTGIVATLVFLDKNNLMPTCSESSLFKFVLRVAQHSLVPSHWDNAADREVIEMAHWINQNSRAIQKGERPLRWHRLRRILVSFGCTFDHVGGVGNRMNIYRNVEKQSRLGRTKVIPLQVQVQYAGEGSEVKKNTLNYLRQQLQLDEQHGCDSRIFYESDTEPDDFIQEYRTLLRRLAKL